MILYNELNWYIVTNQYCALCNSFYYIHILSEINTTTQYNTDGQSHK